MLPNFSLQREGTSYSKVLFQEKYFVDKTLLLEQKHKRGTKEHKVEYCWYKQLTQYSAYLMNYKYWKTPLKEK